MAPQNLEREKWINAMASPDDSSAMMANETSSLTDDNSMFYSSDDSVSDAYFQQTSASPSLTLSPDLPELATLSASRHPSYGAILEDSPASPVPQLPPLYSMPPRPPQLQSKVSSKSSRRRQLRQQQKLEQQQREWLVRQVRGKPQDPTQWKDIVWLILFLAQVVVIAFFAIRLGTASVFTAANPHASKPSETTLVSSADDDDSFFSHLLHNEVRVNSTGVIVPYQPFQIDLNTALQVVTVSGIYACIISALTVGFMLIVAKSMILIALILSMAASLGWTLLGFAIKPFGLITMIGFMFLLGILIFTLWTWDRIHFWSINLFVALSGLSVIPFLGTLVFTSVAFGWCILWSMAFVGIIDALDAPCTPLAQDDCGADFWVYLALLFSLIWTNLVIKNIVQVVVSSAIGSWWFEDHVHTSTLRHILTTSLGSICLGSLVMFPARLLQTLCCGYGGARLHSCNRWAYAYIGLYSYSFLNGGYKARQLFEAREWMAVAGDNLTSVVMFLVSLVIAGSTGTFAVLLEEVDGFEFTSFHKPIISAFIIGSTIGLILSNVMLLGIMDAAVNTVLVCFAADPLAFERQYPRLSQDMRQVWTQHVWEPTAD